MAHEIDGEVWCSECKKHFRSQNPAIKNGAVVCWDCSDITIMGKPKYRNEFVKGVIETCDHCNKRVETLWQDSDHWMLCPVCWSVYHLYKPEKVKTA